MKPKKLFLVVLVFISALAGTLHAQTGVLGNALSFNGVNQYVSVPNFGDIAPTNEVTVEFWANAGAIAQQSAFMLQPDNTSDRFNCHISYNNGNTYWDFGNINTSGRVDAPNPPNTVSNWVHYALVASYSGNYMLIYTNGNLFATNAGMTPFVPGSYELRIGGNTSYFFNGQLAEFCVWNVARTQAQIQSDLGRTLTGNEANLLLYYRFDSSSGAVATNSAASTGAAYNGVLVNNPAWVASSAAGTVVTTTNDSGAGSLRYVVSNAVNNAVITFDPSLSGQTIQITNGAILISTDCTIDASALPNGILLNGNHASSIFNVGGGVTAAFNYLTFTNGRASNGGAIYNNTGILNFTNCTFVNNLAFGGNGDDGGAIFSQNGTMILVNCMFSTNSAGNYGGAIYGSGGNVTLMNCTFSTNNAAAFGGAVCNFHGTFMVLNCTFTKNIAKQYLGGAIANLSGIDTLVNCVFSANTANTAAGAIYVGDTYQGTSGILNLTNCSFVGNFCTSGGVGGALFLDSGAVASLLNCTITGNSVTNGSGAGIYNSAGTLALTNCIVAGNAPDNISGSFGSFSGINNLTNGNPMLSALGNYGGSVQTMLPLPGSPALDAGNDAAVTGLTTDARGYPRISGAHVDIGAAELQTAIVTTTADSGPGSLRAAASGYVDAGASITFAPNLSGQTITLTSGQITLQSGPIRDPDGQIETYGTLTIDASALPGGIAISGNHASGIFYIPIDGLIYLKSLTLTNGNGGNGGAIDVELGQLTLDNCSLVGNSASLGGAIYNDGLVVLNDSTLSGNSALNNGGAILNAFSPMSLNECTLSGNSAPGGGGAIYNELDGQMSLNECTLSGNSAANGTGGAIYNGLSDNSYSSLSLKQCTVSGNSAANSSAGGIFNDDSDGDVTSLNNSIVSSNTPVNFAGSFSGTPNLVGGNAKLAPLGNYGGPTQTMPPLPGSPAIDAAVSSSFTTDQRGFPRVLGPAPDLGAVEGIFNPAGPGLLTVAPQLENGTFQFGFTNYEGMTQTILTTTNLALPLSQWTILGTAVETPAGSGNFQFNDQQTTNYLQRYYRATSP